MADDASYRALFFIVFIYLNVAFNVTVVVSLNAAWIGSLAIALIFFAGHLSGALVKRFGCRFTTLLGGISLYIKPWPLLPGTKHRPFVSNLQCSVWPGN